MSDPEVRDATRRSFDAAADRYQRARPEYPAELFDSMIELAGLVGAHLVEVGCATGKATLPLARRGFRITAVELGASLSEAARQNCRAHEVAVVYSTFEAWDPPDVGLGSRDPGTGRSTATAKPRDSWRPEVAAFWSATHVCPEGGDPFFV